MIRVREFEGSRVRGFFGPRVLVFVLLSSVIASSQQTPPQQRPPVFRGEAVLVTVDVYPQREGKIVEGLKAEDFQILEDGKPQAVENVEFIRVEPSLSESERRDPGSISEMLRQASDSHNRVFVVFLDQMHVTMGGSHATRRPMVDTLNRIIGETDMFGVMTQNTDPRALTFGRRLLTVEEQLSKYWNWGERHRITPDPLDPVEGNLEGWFKCKPPTPQDPCPLWWFYDNGQQRYLYEHLIERRREDRTLTALENLVDRLAGLREARTVALVVTEGWRLFRPDRNLANEAGVYGPQMPPVGSSGGTLTLGDKSRTPNVTLGYMHEANNELVRLANLENERRFRDLLTDANRANVSFYPINPSGMPSVDTPISESRPPSLVEDGNRLRLRTEAMRTLAENTDGIAIVNTNDLAAGMKRIVDDVSAYYLLGYYSTNTAHDGRYRRIEVKAKTPGLNVRARRGYYAPNNKPARESFTTAPSGPEPPKGLDTALGELSRLRVSADVFTRGTLAGAQAQIVVEMASSRVGAMPWSGGADVQIVVTPDGGAALPAVTARIEPGARGVLVSVPVQASVGAVRVVSKMTAAGESLEDTLAITRAAAPLVGEAILYRGRPAATSPLRPVADLQYRRIERVHVEWAIGGEIDQRSARLLGRNGQPLAIPVTVTERETDGRKVVAADLNLAPLSFGEYVIELTAGKGTETTIRLVAFRVVQ